MRVLLATGIYPPDAGGPATYTRALARALTSSGEDQVQVVCYGDNDEIVESDGYLVQRISRSHSLFFRYWNFFLAVWSRARDADVIYLQGPVSEGFPGTLAAFFANKPTIMKVVGDYAWEVYMQKDSVENTNASQEVELLDNFIKHRHKGKIWLLEMIERWTAQRAKRIIVPSNYLKRIVRSWNVPMANVSVIYNFASALSLSSDFQDLRKKYELELNKRIILTAVRAVPWKNIDFIIRLLPSLPSDVVLVVVGDGPSLESWKMEAEKRNLGSRVLFMGKLSQDQLAGWYQVADCFVLPSGYEGFPNVITEAISMGLPCFVSDKGGNPETRELLGSNVTVLPYLDDVAWKTALSNPWKQRNLKTHDGAIDEVMDEVGEKNSNLPKKLLFNVFVKLTRKKIESVI